MVAPSDLIPPAGLTIPTDGSETVEIAQRKGSDPYLATFSVYDRSGRLTDVYQPPVTDGDPNSSTYSQTVSPHWHYDYDAAGDETDQIDPKGEDSTNPASGETQFAFDEFGDQVSRTLPDGEKETSTFDAFGREATHTDFNGNVASDTYYPASSPHAGMLQQVAYTGASGSGKATQTVGYTYDALGRPLTTTDASGTTTDHFDDLGNLIEQDTPQGTIHYAYNLASGRHIETYTDNTDTTYGYDLQGRLSTVTVNKLDGQTLTTPLVTQYAYDAAGNELTETLPDGEVTSNSYDDLNRLTAVSQQQGSTTVFSQSYVLNDGGTRHSSHEAQVQPGGSTVTTSQRGRESLFRVPFESKTPDPCFVPVKSHFSGDARFFIPCQTCGRRAGAQRRLDARRSPTPPDGGHQLPPMGLIRQRRRLDPGRGNRRPG